MEDLIKINKDFNNNLDSSFSLTKMFKKGGLLVETVNKILTISLCIGAFSQLPSLVEKLEPASINHALEVKTQSLYSDAIKINKDNIKSLSDSGIDNIYKSYNKDQLIVTAVGSEFTSSDPVKEDLSNKLLKVNGKSLTGNYASHGGHNINGITPMSEMLRFNFEDQDRTDFGFIILDPDVFESSSTFSSDYPTLFKHKSLFVFAHELNHITNAQTDYISSMSNKTDNIVPLEIAKETSSDLFGAIVVMQSEELNHSESLELLDDIFKFRLNSHHNYGDLGHATYAGIKNFQTMLENNPEMLDKLKSLDLERLDEAVMGFSSGMYSHMINKVVPENTDNPEKFVLMSSLNIDTSVSPIIKDFKKDLDVKFSQTQGQSKKQEILANLKKDSENFNPTQSTLDKTKISLSSKYK